MAAPPYEMNIGAHLASYDVLLYPPFPIVFPRDASGKPGSQYSPLEPVAMHVVMAVSLCQDMLAQQKVRDHFETVAIKYSSGRPNSWYSQGSNAMTTKQVTDTFIGKIRNRFPLVFVDYALKNPDTRGFHTRRPWNGDFEPRHQAISINGKRTDHMSAAWEKAKDGTNEDRKHSFRTFLFATATTFLHEIGHVFVTYLTAGRSDTPPEINALKVYIPESGGEVGRALESLIFGGTLYFHRDPDSGVPPEDQCGIACLRTSIGAHYRIKRGTIDHNASLGVTYKFPFDLEASPEPIPKTLGADMAPDTLTDPLARSEVAHLVPPPPTDP